MITIRNYLGLFFITLATLMYEILLTRIFSVMMFYHFAFMAISVAMFGMTVGALIVYLFPNYFSQFEKTNALAFYSLLFAIAIVTSFLVQLSLPLISGATIVAIAVLVITYLITSIPFIFSGIVVSLSLTKYPSWVSKLYAADLIGAACGCMLLVYVLKITDGPTAVIIVGLLAGIGAWFFSWSINNQRIVNIYLLSCFILMVLSAVSVLSVWSQSPIFRLSWAKGIKEKPPLYEKWNSFSRIAVRPIKANRPFGWGLSSVYSLRQHEFNNLFLTIDSCAATVLTPFNGNLTDLEYLKYDISNLVHYIRPNSKVLIIGVGGGRDVLSALVFHQQSITGIEVNPNTLNAVNQRFGDYTGHLDRNSKVHLVADEARSYITRSSDKFDIIQASLIDTWAATAAGAFTLTENSLYTTEAWKTFLDHLTPTGVISFSRWYFLSNPGEMYRLVSLASTSLREFGIEHPQNHLVIVRSTSGADSLQVGTMLVSRSPFSNQDIANLEKVANNMHFQVIFSLKKSLDPVFEEIIFNEHGANFFDHFPLNLAAPTDDSPFFFNLLKFRHVFDHAESNINSSFNLVAIKLLLELLGITGVLALFGIILPLLIATRKTVIKEAMPFLVFFSAIGFGFILIEISQMQRLMVFLGNPTYALSVVLFTLLLSSGLGSWSIANVLNQKKIRLILVRMVNLLIVLSFFGIVTPDILTTFRGAGIFGRILVAVVILFPLGFFMGMPFPSGMKIASSQNEVLTPWFWGINGATSVVASVLAVVIAMASSITITFWCGVGCYIFALWSLSWQIIVMKRSSNIGVPQENAQSIDSKCYTSTVRKLGEDG